MSAIDFDRSGISRQSSRVNLGPSLGWVDIEGAILTITSGMSLALPRGVTQVNVNAAGAVALTLPRARGVLAIPVSLALIPIGIIDVGGFADAFPITINAAPGETIGNLASVSLAIKFGAVFLRPNPDAGTWSTLS